MRGPANRWIVGWLMLALHWRQIGLIAGLSGMVLTVLFGIVGFGCHNHGVACFYFDPGTLPDEPRPSWSTIVYLAFQLLVLNSGTLNGPVAPTLELARFLGVISLLVTTFTALSALFADRLEAWVLGQLEGHVIVCGFGNKGAPLVEDLLYWGLPVVVVEQQARESDVARLHDRGAHVVVGDATDRSVLVRAGCERAGYIVVASGNDATEVEVILQVLQAVMLAPASSQPRPVLYVHIQSPDLDAEVEALLRENSEGEPGEPLYWQMFNMYDRVARSILAKHFVFHRGEVERRTSEDDFATIPDSRLGLAIVGDTPLAGSLIDNLLRAWRMRHAQRQERLRLVVIGRAAQQRIDSLKGRRQDLETVLEIEVVERAVTDLTPDEQRSVLAGVSTIYVCRETDAAAAASVFALWRQAADLGARLIVSFDRRAGLPDLVRQAGVVRTMGGAEQLVTFSLAESFLGADLAFNRVTDRLAALIHEEYLAARRAEQRTRGALTNPSPYLDPLNARAQSVARSSSLRQAQHILHKLERIGCTIRRRRAVDPARFKFADHELDDLAVLEHDRWNDERLLDGWEVGSPTVRENRISEYLVPWDRIPCEIQKYDFAAIENLPMLLARVGFEIVRKPPSAAGQARSA